MRRVTLVELLILSAGVGVVGYLLNSSHPMSGPLLHTSLLLLVCSGITVVDDLLRP